MSAIVIEHVNVADLPETWRAQMPALQNARVTVRIEEGTVPPSDGAENNAAVDLIFGMWRDREDMADVEAYVRKLRAPRYNRNGSRNMDSAAYSELQAFQPDRQLDPGKV